MSWRYTVDEEHFWIYFRPIERFRPSTQTDLSSEERQRGGERGREASERAIKREGRTESSERFAEQTQKRLERISKKLEAERKKGNGLIIILINDVIQLNRS